MNDLLDNFFYLNRVTIQLGRWYYRLMRAMCRRRGHRRQDLQPYVAMVCGSPMVMHPWRCRRCGDGEL